jgi:hypothetical protein
MPQFIIRKEVDALVHYEALIDAHNADEARRAAQILHHTFDWVRDPDVSELESEYIDTDYIVAEDEPIEVVESMMTVVIMEDSSPFSPAYSGPLIYTAPIWLKDKPKKLMKYLARQRYEDIEGGRPSKMVSKEIAAGLRVLFAFAGDNAVILDQRS